MQQNVVGTVGVTVPLGVPSTGVHIPPFGGVVTLALADVTFGLPAKAVHAPDVAASTWVWQLGGDEPSM